MPDSNDILIRQLTELLPANSAAAKALRIVFDDGSGDTDTAEAKQNTIGAVLDLVYALRGVITGSNLTMSTNRLLGRTTASTGAIEEITVGDGLNLTTGELSAEVTAASMAAAIAAAVTGLFDFKGTVDCSANPNFPAASKGDVYKVSFAGRIGGASGTKVSVGDSIIATADNAGGTLASVGSSWYVAEGNIEGISTDGLAIIQAANYAAMRALLDLEAGTDFNAFRAEVDKLSILGPDIASASTTDLSAATGDFANITGTTTITALGTIGAGIRRLVRFADALILTHNATGLILPTGADIETATNDIAEFISLGSGNWQCVRYLKADGTPLIAALWGGIGGTLADQADLSTALGERLVAASNLSDLADSGTARSNLGLGDIATQNASAVAITGGTLAGITGMGFRDTSAAHDVTLGFASSTNLTAGRTLTVDVVNNNRTVKLAGNLDFGGSFTTTGSGTIAMGGYTLTVPTTGTAALRDVVNAFSAAQSITVNGAASTPAFSITGTPFSGGTATTTKPLCLIETAGATSNNWSTSATMLGVNAPSLFAGNLFDFQVNGVLAARLSCVSGAVKLTLVGYGNFIECYDSPGGTLRAYLTGGRWISDDYSVRDNSASFGGGGSGHLGASFSNLCSVNFSSDATFWGTKDLGFKRGSAGVLKITDGSTGYGTLDAGAFKVGGSAGVDFSGAVASITIVKGIVTAAS